MSKYQSWGDNDLAMQIILNGLDSSMREGLGKLAQIYDIEVAFAAFATTLGALAGEMQALSEQHSEECEKCAAKNYEFHELLVKNFTAAFAHRKREQEAEFEEARGDADALLSSVFKGMHK